MCGLIFVMSCEGAVDRGSFTRARDSMIHRGPDASGSVYLRDDKVALGHRRLSIIDLSESANQPMQLGRIWVVFNGEIYNYPELRSELGALGCKFTTHSDTEILLHGYKMWGNRLCDHLMGMFAFAIWDDEIGKLYMARDHLGQKPLYYGVFDTTLIVASEIKAIKSLVPAGLEIREESIIDHIIYDHVPEPYTWYKNIKCVLPGHQLEALEIYGNIAFKEKQYWTFMPPVSPWSISPTDACHVMGEEIEKSVKSHMLSDVEVGAFLSGGVDSSCIAAIANRHMEKPIKTFSIGFGRVDDELPIARETAEYIGSRHKEGIVSEYEFQESLSKINNIFDQPFADSSLVPTERVSELASREVKVVLTGDGGDEAFGGYSLGKYISPLVGLRFWKRQKSARSNIRSLQNNIKDILGYYIYGDKRWQENIKYPRYKSSINKQLMLLTPEMEERIREYDYSWMYKKYLVPGLDPFRQAQWIHLKFILPGKMLVKVDRCSMTHSLEARAPFLSHNLIQTMLSIPTEIRNPTNDWYKGLFRSWARDIIPQKVFLTPKRGFGSPASWMPVPSIKKSKNLLNLCIEHRYITPSALPAIRKQPRLLWKLLQVEKMLEGG